MKKFDPQEHQTLLEDSDVTRIINTLLLLFTCAGIVLIGVMLWVLFSPQIKDAINYQKISTCDYVLPSLPGEYCLAWDENKNIFYYDSKYKIKVK